MSTLSEHTGNGNPTETSLQPRGTKEQLDGVLQQFEVLPSRIDRVLFKYIYVYLLGLLFLVQLLTIISFLAMNTQVGSVLLQVGFGAPPALATILAIWRFHVWRLRTTNALRDLIENKRIALPDGDASTSYLCFLELCWLLRASVRKNRYCMHD
jgi:hypothetical protein